LNDVSPSPPRVRFLFSRFTNDKSMPSVSPQRYERAPYIFSADFRTLFFPQSTPSLFTGSFDASLVCSRRPQSLTSACSLLPVFRTDHINGVIVGNEYLLSESLLFSMSGQQRVRQLASSFFSLSHQTRTETAFLPAPLELLLGPNFSLTFSRSTVRARLSSAPFVTELI